MMKRKERVIQKKKLYRDWGFRLDERNNDNDPFIWRLKIMDIEIVWNIKHQTGAYTIYGEQLSLLLGWEMLEDLMELLIK